MHRPPKLPIKSVSCIVEGGAKASQLTAPVESYKLCRARKCTKSAIVDGQEVWPHPLKVYGSCPWNYLAVQRIEWLPSCTFLANAPIGLSLVVVNYGPTRTSIKTSENIQKSHVINIFEIIFALNGTIEIIIKLPQKYQGNFPSCPTSSLSGTPTILRRIFWLGDLEFDSRIYFISLSTFKVNGSYWKYPWISDKSWIRVVDSRYLILETTVLIALAKWRVFAAQI